MKRLSSMAYKEDGRGRFTWDPTNQVISMDGFPLRVSDIFQSWRNLVGELEITIEKLCRGYDMSPLLEHLDNHLHPDPKYSAAWLRDSRSKISVGYSFLEEPSNGLKSFRLQLLGHLVKDKELFQHIDGKTQARHGKYLFLLEIYFLLIFQRCSMEVAWVASGCH